MKLITLPEYERLIEDNNLKGPIVLKEPTYYYELWMDKIKGVVAVFSIYMPNGVFFIDLRNSKFEFDLTNVIGNI